MEIPIYFINSFTDQLYTGNPAAVCVLRERLTDAKLQKIAAEIHLPATSFLLKESGNYIIRWFGPEYEIELCGHGTLASGYIVLKILELNEVEFLHPSQGRIKVFKTDSQIVIDFPAKNVEPIKPPRLLVEGLGFIPKETYQFKNEKILAIYDKEAVIKELTPNRELLKQLDHVGIIVSSRGDKLDFVSRTFYPRKSLFEDQVTGSSHCFLVPYWSQVLKKQTFYCKQLSPRGGNLFCEIQQNRILIHGKAKLYLQGMISI